MRTFVLQVNTTLQDSQCCHNEIHMNRNRLVAQKYRLVCKVEVYLFWRGWSEEIEPTFILLEALFNNSVKKVYWIDNLI